MTLNKFRMRVAGWFILLALKISALFRPVPKDVSEGGDSTTTKSLRIETDVETPLSPGQLALLLRNLAKDSLHAETLLALAEGVEGARPAPNGTRGSIVLGGDDMKMLPDTVARTMADLYAQTRHVTREPGNLVEIVLSVVVTSNATDRDPFPVTELSITHTRDDNS